MPKHVDTENTETDKQKHLTSLSKKQTPRVDCNSPSSGTTLAAAASNVCTSCVGTTSLGHCMRVPDGAHPSHERSSHVGVITQTTSCLSVKQLKRCLVYLCSCSMHTYAHAHDPQRPAGRYFSAENPID